MDQNVGILRNGPHNKFNIESVSQLRDRMNKLVLSIKVDVDSGIMCKTELYHKYKSAINELGADSFDEIDKIEADISVGSLDFIPYAKAEKVLGYKPHSFKEGLEVLESQIHLL